MISSHDNQSAAVARRQLRLRYRDGKAVSSAAALPIEGAMYIALVATEAGEQGKGYAEAVMRHAIKEGEAGMVKRRLVLHASDMGRPLYQSMGFGAGCRIPLLAAGRPSAELRQ